MDISVSPGVLSTTPRCDATGKSGRILPESKEGGRMPLVLLGSCKLAPFMVAVVDKL